MSKKKTFHTYQGRPHPDLGKFSSMFKEQPAMQELAKKIWAASRECKKPGARSYANRIDLAKLKERTQPFKEEFLRIYHSAPEEVKVVQPRPNITGPVLDFDDYVVSDSKIEHQEKGLVPFHEGVFSRNTIYRLDEAKQRVLSKHPGIHMIFKEMGRVTKSIPFSSIPDYEIVKDLYTRFDFVDRFLYVVRRPTTIKCEFVEDQSTTIRINVNDKTARGLGIGPGGVYDLVPGKVCLEYVRPRNDNDGEAESTGSVRKRLKNVKGASGYHAKNMTHNGIITPKIDGEQIVLVGFYDEEKRKTMVTLTDRLGRIVLYESDSKLNFRFICERVGNDIYIVDVGKWEGIPLKNLAMGYLGFDFVNSVQEDYEIILMGGPFGELATRRIAEDTPCDGIVVHETGVNQVFYQFQPSFDLTQFMIEDEEIGMSKSVIKYEPFDGVMQFSYDGGMLYPMKRRSDKALPNPPEVIMDKLNKPNAFRYLENHVDYSTPYAWLPHIIEKKKKKITKHIDGEFVPRKKMREKEESISEIDTTLEEGFDGSDKINIKKE
jgi:hypothetical protein